KRDDQRDTAFAPQTGRHCYLPRFKLRGLTSKRIAWSGTVFDSDRAVPPFVNSASGPVANEPEPRSARLPVCTRMATRIFRMRSSSASDLFELAASGHHGPSVRLAADKGTNALPSPIGASLGTYVRSRPAPCIVHTQFSPGGQPSIDVETSRPGGAGP